MSVLRIFMFGGLRVYLGSTPLLPFPTRKTRSLFAYLVTYRGRPHPRPVLAGTFWGDMPDTRAHRNLNTTLWRLRRILPGDYLHVEADTIAFNMAAGYWLDVAEFEQGLQGLGALNEGRPLPENALASLQRAVNLYRGDLLAGMYEPWGLEEAERLRSLYLQALLTLLQHWKEQGEYHAAVQYGQRLLAADPLQEHIHREMIDLYSLMGQRSTALAQFETCRQLLHDELGVAPLPETRALYEQIRSAALPGSDLEDVPSFSPLPHLPHTPFDDFGQLPLVGRWAEIGVVKGYLEQACHGRGCMVLFEGEAGVGKSRLVQETAFVAEQRGVRVLRGGCHEMGQPPPFHGVINALRSGIARLVPHELSGYIAPVWVSQVALLLPELQPLHPDLPPLPPLSASQAQGTLLEALAQYVTGLGRLGPCLVAIEDLHWADQATLDALCYLLPRVTSARVLLLGSIRSEELADHHALQEAMRCLEGTGALRRLPVGRLGQEETAQLVQHALGLPLDAPALGSRIYRETEGNPFFVVEVLKELCEAGLLNRDEAGRWSPLGHEAAVGDGGMLLPERIRQAVNRRLARLDKEGRATLEQAAVLGREFDFDLLLQASGQGEEALLEASDDLLRRQLLVEVDDALRFSHDKIRQVVYEGLSRARRRWLHRQAGQALEAMAPSRIEELALHFYHGEVRDKAIAYGIAAGDRARTLGAQQEAIAHYRRVLTLLGEGEATRGQVLVSLGQIYHLLADKEEALSAFHQALAIWLAHDEAAQAAEAYYAIAGCYFRANCFDQALEQVQHGIAWAEARGLEQATFRGYRMLTRCRQVGGDRQGMQAALEHTLLLAERRGDLGVLAACHQLQGDLCTLQGEQRESLEQNLQAAALLEQVEDHDDRRARLYNNIAWRYLALGQAGEARRYVEQGFALSRRIGGVISAGWLHATSGTIYAYLGQWPEARAEVAAGLPLAARIDNGRMEGVLRRALGLIALAEGKSQEAIEELEQAVALAGRFDRPHLAEWTVLLADACVDAGQVERAQEWAEQAWTLARERDNRPVMGLVERVQGKIESARGRWAQARQAFERCLGMLDDRESPVEAARARYEYGLAALAAGDRERGQAMIEEALRAFVALGAKADEARARSSLGRRQVRFDLARPEALAGRPLRAGEMVTVMWTVDAGLEDERLGQREGKVALRRARILRLLAEAGEQGGVPTHADLARALDVTERTIRRDVAALRAAGHLIHTRGGSPRL
ncbi:MAG: AAA family ATPase [Anaerolineae bacterium]|nr:AAA family ATPase [Anaerolineae bacterium]